MGDLENKRLERLVTDLSRREVDEIYADLYEDDAEFGRIFAILHRELDEQFDFMNYKARNGAAGHFNADNSRDLIDTIDRLDALQLAMRKAGVELTIEPEYERVVNGARSWLVPSGGSAIPEKFTPIGVEKYAPVFWRGTRLAASQSEQPPVLKMIGEGAYAQVFKLKDPRYGITLAVKRLKPGSSEREIDRFRREFDLMKQFRYPYVLEVHQFNESDMSYTMEFCESTLKDYVRSRNNQPAFSFAFRKRIALQFLYSLNFLHRGDVYHRDLSYKNVLLRVYSDVAVTVKLSDFGLAKPAGSDLTKTDSAMKGTIQDPSLDLFSNYSAINDLYAVGFILSYIFAGVERLVTGSTELARIVHQCSHTDPDKRYRSVREVIGAIEQLNEGPR